MRPSVGSVATLLAVACAAYFAADISHEALGHGGGCMLLGGKSVLLSTTYEACSIRSRLIDGAGPVAGIAAAVLAWTWLRLAQPKTIAARAFLCLTFAFAIFFLRNCMRLRGKLHRGLSGSLGDGSLRLVAGRRLCGLEECFRRLQSSQSRFAIASLMRLVRKRRIYVHDVQSLAYVMVHSRHGSPHHPIPPRNLLSRQSGS